MPGNHLETGKIEKMSRVTALRATRQPYLGYPSKKTPQQALKAKKEKRGLSVGVVSRSRTVFNGHIGALNNACTACRKRHNAERLKTPLISPCPGLSC